MTCFYPIKAIKDGSGGVQFLKHDAPVWTYKLPCGRCRGCRLERSRQWAVRCMHEASLHAQNCFVTLTYDDAHLPGGRSILYRDYQLFMRRLRKGRKPDRVRFFAAGEYGENFERPHFHACLFNCSFGEDEFLGKSPAGFDLARSYELDDYWRNGFASFGSLTFESAAYVARYVMKKITGDDAKAHYEVCNVETGEIVDRVPELVRMSRRPGIGADWLRLYWKEVILNGTCIVRGVESPAPRFYLKRLSKLDAFGKLSQERRDAMLRNLGDNTRERLAVKEVVQEARIRSLKRKIN